MKVNIVNGNLRIESGDFDVYLFKPKSISQIVKKELSIEIYTELGNKMKISLEHDRDDFNLACNTIINWFQNYV